MTASGDPGGGAGIATKGGAPSPAAASDWGARARHYADYAVPKNRPFAEALVSLARPVPGDRILDVATGPGLVAIEAARQAGGPVEVVATDLAPEWEPIVAEFAAAAGIAGIAFRAMPGDALAFPDGAFDVAFCEFGLMFMPDPPAALRELRRVLRPGGRLGVAVWSTPDKVDHFLPLRIISSALPPVPEAERGPSPTGLGEPGLIERLVTEAGFRDVAVERITREHVVADPDEEWRGWSEGRSPVVAGALGALAPDVRTRIQGEVLAALEARRRDGEIRLASEATLVAAVA